MRHVAELSEMQQGVIKHLFQGRKSCKIYRVKSRHRNLVLATGFKQIEPTHEVYPGSLDQERRYREQMND